MIAPRSPARRAPLVPGALLVAFFATLAAGCASDIPTPTAPGGVGWLASAAVEPPTDDAAAGATTTDTNANAAGLGGQLSLKPLIAYAVAHNPKVYAARERWLAASLRSAQVTLPDPKIAYTYFPQPIETRVGPQRHKLMLTQGVPWPGRLSAEASARDAEADVARLTYEIAARDAIAEVQVAYHELRYWHAARQVVSDNLEIARRLAALAEAWQARETPDSPGPWLPARRSVTLVDALKARAQEAQIAFDQVTVAEELQVAEAVLNRALGREANAPLGVPAPLADVRLTLTEDRLRSLGLAHRQELERAAAQVRAAGFRVDVAELMAVPDVSLGVLYAFIGSKPTDRGLDNDALALTLGLSLPIFGGRNQARVDAAAHRAQAAREEGRRVALDLLATLTRLYTRERRAERLLTLYDNVLLPEAAETLAQVEALERDNETTLGEILEAHGVWLNFALARERARTESFQAIARLEQLIGQPLAAYLERLPDRRARAKANQPGAQGAKSAPGRAPGAGAAAAPNSPTDPTPREDSK